MTLDDLRRIDKDFLIPREVASVLGCNPYAISVEAREGTLPFPYIRTGTRTRIPRLGFIAWMEGRNTEAPPGQEN